MAFLDYSEGAERIASLVAERLKSAATDATAPQVRSDLGVESRSVHVLPTHKRHLPAELSTIKAPHLVELVADPRRYVSALARAQFARELVIYLNWKHQLGVGQPYGAWRTGSRLFLSTLPNFSSPQRTLEFEIDQPAGELRLTSEWSSDDERYAPLHYSEWQPAVRGLTADRSDQDLDREGTILILERKGAAFGFPIVPTGDAAEKLCNWLNEEPPADYLEWSRDPRLVSGRIGVWIAAHHRPTGVGMLLFVLQGRWRASAFIALDEALRIMLPSRHRLKIISPGAVRVCVPLAFTPDVGHRIWEDYPRETEIIWPAVNRTYATIARMVAADRQLAVPLPQSVSALPALSDARRSLFAEAVDSLGNDEFPKRVDGAELNFMEATWIKARHRPNRAELGTSPIQFWRCCDTSRTASLYRERGKTVAAAAQIGVLTRASEPGWSPAQSGFRAQQNSPGFCLAASELRRATPHPRAAGGGSARYQPPCRPRPRAALTLSQC